MDYRLGEAEYRLLELVWEEEPISSTALCKVGLDVYGWKKSTVYTMLKRLSDKNILKIENATVTSLAGKDEVNKQESEALIKKSFGGSLPGFMAAFLRDRKLTKEEAEELQKLIREAMK